MNVRLRHFEGYYAYACPRCINGSMAWELDKVGSAPYLKCILCGKEVREKRFKKAQQISPNEAESETEVVKTGKNSGNRIPVKDIKWHFPRR